MQSILFINYLEKERTINNECYIALLVHLKKELTKKRPQMKKKKCSFTKKMRCHKSIVTMAKLHESHFELVPHPHYSPDLAPADLKRMPQQKRFGSNEETISETEMYFEAKNKSFNKNRHQVV